MKKAQNRPVFRKKSSYLHIFTQTHDMKNDAIAVANYFVDKASSDKDCKFTLLRLVKYVYIAYGFSLAILDQMIIDDRFDVVEAWKYGPVIPSVYHSFKHNGNSTIRQKAQIVTNETSDGHLTFSTPVVNDEKIKKILDFVWDRYKEYSTSDLIKLLHKNGTPWHFCYREGENIEIPNDITKFYYKSVISNALKS